MNDMTQRPADVQELPRHEPEELWRVYRHEWTVAHMVETGDGETVEHSFARAWAYYDEHFAGRVHREHVQVVAADLCYAGTVTAKLMLFLPAMKGEFKHKQTAQEYIERDVRLRLHGVLVQRHSAQDHLLRNYGFRKLPEGATTDVLPDTTGLG